MKVTDEKPKRGRPKGSGKINQYVIDKICEGIESGLKQEDAATRAGIHKSTFYKWRDKGEVSRSGIYRDFFDALEKAQAKLRARVENTIYSTALKHKVKKRKQVVIQKTGQIVWLEEEWDEVDTGLLKFIAERRYSEDWGRKDKLDITSGDKPFEGTLFGAVMGQGTDEER